MRRWTCFTVLALPNEHDLQARLGKSGFMNSGSDSERATLCGTPPSSSLTKSLPYSHSHLCLPPNGRPTTPALILPLAICTSTLGRTFHTRLYGRQPPPGPSLTGAFIDGGFSRPTTYQARVRRLSVSEQLITQVRHSHTILAHAQPRYTVIRQQQLLIRRSINIHTATGAP